MKLTGAEYITRALEGYGVTHLFFVPTIFAQTLAEMERSPIKRIMAHDERAAAYMADGYARACGRPGVVAAQMIGTSNLAAGLRDAYMANTPLIALTGGANQLSRSRRFYQEVEAPRVFDPVTKYNAHVGEISRLPDLMAQAFRATTTGRPGPVHLSLEGHYAEDIELAECDLELIVEPQFSSLPPFRPVPLERELRGVVARIAGAERPVIVAGGGVVQSGAETALRRVAEAFGVPVATSLNAKSVIPDDHPLALGVVGLYARQSANLSVLEADLVVYVGSQTGSQVTNNWRVPERGTEIIQINIDPDVVGAHYPNTHGLVGDARETLEAMLAMGHEAPDRSGWLRRIDELRAEGRANDAGFAESDAVPMRPERLVREIGRLAPSDAIIVCDTGHAGLWCAGFMDLNSPGQSFLRAAGTLGWSFPASLGAKLAVGDRPVILFTGDGGLWYHLAEIETAVRWGINVVAVINNNRSLNEEIMAYREPYGGELHGRHEELWVFEDVDFADVATTLGAQALKVTRPSEMEGALDTALHTGTFTLIDVRTDIDALAEFGVCGIPVTQA